MLFKRNIKSFIIKMKKSCVIDHHDIMIIRHGRTHYNNACEQELENVPPMKFHPIKTSLEYLDCPLDDIGIEQAKSLHRKVKNMTIKKVFSSPLRRCLETTLYSLYYHPQKYDIEIVVVPLITEICHTTHDGSISIEEKKRYYEENFPDIKIDWSLMNNLDENYNLRYMNRYEEFEKILISNGNTEKDITYTSLAKISFDIGKRLESFRSLHQRSIRVKDFLLKQKKKYEEEFPNQEGNYLVYTHSSLISMMSLVRNYEWENEKSNILSYNKINDDNIFPGGVDDYAPKERYFPKNCEMVFLDLKK